MQSHKNQGNYHTGNLYNRLIRGSLILDEVQLYPVARQMIKQLVADGRYDYIETSSLISIKKNVKNILIPSEEEHIKMYPMNLEEFLLAMGDDVTYENIKECYTKKKEVGSPIHRKVLNLSGTPFVNSDIYKKHTSLDKLRKKFGKKINNYIVLYDKDVRNIDGVMHYPLYMTVFL